MTDAKHTPGDWAHGRLDTTTITEIEGKFIYCGDDVRPVAIATNKERR